MTENYKISRQVESRYPRSLDLRLTFVRYIL